MNLDACAEDQRDALQRRWQQQEALFELHYRPDRFARASAQELRVLAAERVQAMQQVLTRLPARPHSKAELVRSFEQAGFALRDDEQSLLLDLTLVPALRADGSTLRTEQLDLAATDPAVRAVFEAFLAASRGEKTRAPRIGILTSAARDVQEAAAFYLQWFKLLGAEPIWIPLDPASRLLRDAGQPFDSPAQACGALLLERQRQTGISPRYQHNASLQQAYCTRADLRRQLESLDGVFFNGGDQSLHLKSLLRADGSDSPELALIRRRFDDGELAVMGTSAGTAVQSGNVTTKLPMIAGGSTAQALRQPARAATPPLPFCQFRQDCPVDINAETKADADALFYRAEGGTGLFRFAVLDTHFSERGRQGRLLALLQQTGFPFAIGVDETTALVVQQHEDHAKLSVIGRAGVWLARRDEKSALHRVSYLLAGDRATLSKHGFSVDLAICDQDRTYKLVAPDAARMEAGAGIHEAALIVSRLGKEPLQLRSDDGVVWQFQAGSGFQVCNRPNGAWAYKEMLIGVQPLFARSED
ncbi:MAG: cyanophycinase [Permianibacter sp.]